MITGFHHLAISVPDLEAAIKFYREAFGFDVEWRDRLTGWEPEDTGMGLRDSKAEYAMLLRDGVRLEIFEFESPVPRRRGSDWRVSDLGLTHICFGVDDVRAEYDRLGRAGMKFFSPPVDQDPWWVYGLDPFGNVVELYESPSPKPAEE